MDSLGVFYRIQALTATLAWSGTSLTYNATLQAPTCVVSNACAGDTVTVTVTGGQTAAGNYTARELRIARHRMMKVRERLVSSTADDALVGTELLRILPKRG